MQMSDMLALVQVLIGAATFIVAVLALIKENPPTSGGNSNHNGEDQAPSPRGAPLGRPFFRQTYFTTETRSPQAKRYPNAGSSTPLAAKAAARSRQVAQRPQGASPPS